MAHELEQGISADCELPSKFVDVLGCKMHYLEQGQGEPMLFIHGIPTYSYLWRNVIPCLSQVAHCYAVDLIGMGFSAKPDIEYTIFDHIRYLEGFIQALNLENITLVMHGWGSVAGFAYAKKFESNVKALAFYESHVRANTTWEMLSLPVQHLATLLKRPGASYKAIVGHNYLVRKLLPHGVLRQLSSKEMSHYEKPYQTEASRRPLWQYTQEVPLGKSGGEVVALISAYSLWLQDTLLPKLMMYGIPGFITTIETVQWARDNLANLVVAEFDEALHFIQESNPFAFAEVLKEWYLKMISSDASESSL